MNNDNGKYVLLIGNNFHLPTIIPFSKFCLLQNYRRNTCISLLLSSVCFYGSLWRLAFSALFFFSTSFIICNYIGSIF